MGRTARCAVAALAAVVAGGALGLAADARAVDGPYDYVAVSFLLLASALVVGGVGVLLVALADRVVGRLPASGSSPEEAAATSTSPLAMPVGTSDTAVVAGPSSLSAARTAAHRHALTARRAAGAATRRAGQHASTAQRTATTSLVAAVSRSIAAVRSTTVGAGAAVPSSTPEGEAPDVSTVPAAVGDRAVPVGAAGSPGSRDGAGPGVPPRRA